MGDPHDVALIGDARAIYGASRLGNATDWEALRDDTQDMLVETTYTDQRERLWMLFIHACALWQLNGDHAALFERLTQIVLAPRDDLGHELYVAVLAHLVAACRELDNAELVGDMHAMQLRLNACEHETCARHLGIAGMARQPLHRISA